MEFRQLDAYEYLRSFSHPESDSVVTELLHKKSGAKIFLMENEDENKVFCVGFRTPPKNSTGVPHILEHSVLCGSERYPLRDPFMELVKGSLQTFLNAMTYPDRTLYPVASTNDKDFRNLADVYLDAVFFPLIRTRDLTFLQEGWRYCLESPEGPLTLNGVVYSEMKGATSSAGDILLQERMAALYPDTPYRYDSGGDPKVIPALTLEEFRSEYERFYHPSNAHIFLYGNLDMEEMLRRMDERALSHFEKREAVENLTLQAADTIEKDRTIPYPVTEEEGGDDGVIFSLNYLLPRRLTSKEDLALQAMAYALIDAPGALITEALLKEGICREVEGGFDSVLYQSNLEITAKGSSEEKEEAFVRITKDILEKVKKEGFPKDILRSYLKKEEFRLREADTDPWPRGLILALDYYRAATYDEPGEMYFDRLEDFEALYEALSTNYFETLFSEMVRDDASNLLRMIPDAGLLRKEEDELKEHLQRTLDSWTDEEKRLCIEKNRELKAFQESEDSEENIKKLPGLSLDEVSRRVQPLHTEEKEVLGTKVLLHREKTKGLVYADYLFTLPNLTEEEAMLLSVFRSALGDFSTETYAYQDLDNRIREYTGGISFSFDSVCTEEGLHRAYLHAEVSCMKENLREALSLMEEMLLRSLLTEEDRLRKVLLEIRSFLPTSLMERGDRSALRRALSLMSESYRFMENTQGLSFLDRVEALKEGEEKKLFESFGILRDRIVLRDHMMVSLTLEEEEEEEALRLLEEMLPAFPLKGEKEREARPDAIPYEESREGIQGSSKVQYTALAKRIRNFEYSGSMKLLQSVLSTEILWKSVREKGGAYGCSANLGKNGIFAFTSYRDPGLRGTIDSFHSLGEEIRNLSLTKDAIRKRILGTIGSMDHPMNAKKRGARALTAYLLNLSEEEMNRRREELLDATLEDLKALAPLFEGGEAEVISVFGNRNCLEEEKSFFDRLRPLKTGKETE